MKKVLAIAAFALISMNVLAQDKKACKADVMESKPGVVIQKEYFRITTFRGLAIAVEYITDLTSNQKLSALDFEFTTGGDNSETVSTLLDPDEVDALLAFFQNMQDNISKSAAPKNYTEYSYITKSGLQAGCYWNNGWKTYLKVDNENSKTDVELGKDDMPVFISFIRQAKTKF